MELGRGPCRTALLADGTVFVDDEDELEEAYAAGLVSDEERARAEAAAAWWVAQLTLPSALVDVARAHFDQARERGLEPLPAPGLAQRGLAEQPPAT